MSPQNLSSSLFLRACRREPVERTPVWLMRQAGRYMPSYRKIRQDVPFLDLRKNPELAARVTLNAVKELDVDAAISFSDLLMIVEPLGFELSYGTDQGPVIGNPVRGAADLRRIKPVDPAASLAYVRDAIQLIRRDLDPGIPLIGFAGAPFTMAAYLIEGRGSKNFLRTKAFMMNEWDAWNRLLAHLTAATADYLRFQIDSGVQAVQIFDSWVGALSPRDFEWYVLPHWKNLVRLLKGTVPVIAFGTGNAGQLPLWRSIGADVVGVDWKVELDAAWKVLGDVGIQGNLDPAVLFSTETVIRSEVQKIMNQAAGKNGHIFNLGHGILPETPYENARALIRVVKELGQRARVTA